VVVAGGISTGDVGVFGTGAWTSGVLGLYILTVWLIKHTQGTDAWVVRERGPPKEQHHGPRSADERNAQRSLGQTGLFIALAVVAILVAGFVAAQTADVLSEQTGLGASLAGFVLGGIATSLPEANSTYSAARLEQYETVFSDAFGTNLFSVMLLFFCDAVFPGGPVLNEVGRFSLFATLLGAAVTAIYVAGLIGRPRKVLLRMGIDSVLVLAIAAGGLLLLYQLRS
jgi:cation:H+ antiporter